MNRNKMIPTAAGIAMVSLAAGAAAYAMNAKGMRRSRRNLKKAVNQAAHTVGQVVGSMTAGF